MKKYMIFALVLLLLVSLWACGEPTQSEGGTENPAQNGETLSPEEGTETPNAETGENASGEDATEGEASQQDPDEPESTVEVPTVEVAHQDVNLLAAATLTAVSMEYPDFVYEGTYTNAEEDHVYLSFQSGGKAMFVTTWFLTQERSEGNTIDLFLADHGYVAFEVKEGEPDASELVPMEESAYSEYLQTLGTLTIHYH